MRYFIPLSLFAVLVLLLTIGLTLKPQELPSPLTDKPAPTFTLPTLDNGQKTMGTADFLGKPWVLNVWASWCVSCRAEHEVLKKFPQHGAIPLVGLDYKDPKADAVAWLKNLGNPYTFVLRDEDGRAAIDFGVYGVPETFVIDGQGIVRLRYAGPLTMEVLEQRIVPLLRQWDTSFTLQ